MTGWFGVHGFSLSRAAQSVTVLLVVAIAWTLAEATWFFLPGEDGRAGDPMTSMAPQALPIQADHQLQTVANLSLFGASQPLVAAGGDLSAPETNLNLTLRGVMANAALAGARAIIAADSGVEESYKIGDTLPGGAVLDQVFADRVILKRGGRLEALYLPKDSDSGLGAGMGISMVNAPSPMANNPGSGYSNLNAGVGERLQEYRQRIINNPQEAFSLARMQPVMEDGRLKGYKLSPNKEKQLFRQVGLRPGDIVTSVNGLSLGDPAAAAQVMTQISSASQLTLTVDRGGQQETLVVPFGK